MRRQGSIFWGLGLVVLVAAGAAILRALWVDPPALAAVCAHHTGPPTICAVRDAVNGLARYGVFGAIALACGIWSIAVPNPAAILVAMCFGILGLIDYNVSWGMLGACLGGWAWLRDPRGSAPSAWKAPQKTQTEFAKIPRYRSRAERSSDSAPRGSWHD